MSLSPTKARLLLETVASGQTRNERGEAAVALLNFLLRQLEELRDLANGYPRNPIDGGVWSDGKALAELCDELTSLLSDRELPEQEELASRLATGMALQVMGHYPEEILPRVLRNSRCREAIAQTEEAIGGYEAIVDDFHRMDLVDLLEEDQLEASSRSILQSVYDAALRLGALRPERLATLEDLQSALRKRLDQNP